MAEEHSSTPWVCCHVRIVTCDKIDELAKQLTEVVFAGLEFKPTAIYDEIQCVKIEEPLLGLCIMLSALGGGQGYELAMTPIHYEDAKNNPTLDLSAHVGL